MTELDVRGLSCPIPVVRTKKAMDDNPRDVITVLLETVTSKENVTRLAASRGYKVKEEAVSGDYRLTLTPSAK
ncbi:MAG: sulfurtransferase TusA family protein [Dehalococcoidales bacterium]|nr:sulfurtransferase TusA family protein [Dehalococcoidales bacterium]